MRFSGFYHSLILLCLILSGCESWDQAVDPRIVGSWEMARIRIGLDAVAGAAGPSQYSSAEEYGTFITMNLDDDGSLAMVYIHETDTIRHTGTWCSEDSWLTLKYESGYEARGRYELRENVLTYGCLGGLVDPAGAGYVQSFTYYLEFERL